MERLAIALIEVFLTTSLLLFIPDLGLIATEYFFSRVLRFFVVPLLVAPR